jgi:hypothetical protein
LIRIVRFPGRWRIRAALTFSVPTRPKKKVLQFQAIARLSSLPGEAWRVLGPQSVLRRRPASSVCACLFCAHKRFLRPGVADRSSFLYPKFHKTRGPQQHPIVGDLMKGRSTTRGGSPRAHGRPPATAWRPFLKEVIHVPDHRTVGSCRLVLRAFGVCQ